MKRIQTQSSKKKIIVSVFAVIVVLLFCIVSAYALKLWPFSKTDPLRTESISNKIDYNKPSDEQTDAGNAIKEDAAKRGSESDENSDTEHTDIPITITSVQPGSTVYIRTLIEKMTSTATCDLEMVGPNNKTYSATVSSQAMASTSTCQGFNVPMDKLSAGKWKITISVKDGSAHGTASIESELE